MTKSTSKQINLTTTISALGTALATGREARIQAQQALIDLSSDIIASGETALEPVNTFLAAEAELPANEARRVGMYLAGYLIEGAVFKGGQLQLIDGATLRRGPRYTKALTDQDVKAFYESWRENASELHNVRAKFEKATKTVLGGESTLYAKPWHNETRRKAASQVLAKALSQLEAIEKATIKDLNAAMLES